MWMAVQRQLRTQFLHWTRQLPLYSAGRYLRFGTSCQKQLHSLDYSNHCSDLPARLQASLLRLDPVELQNELAAPSALQVVLLLLFGWRQNCLQPTKHLKRRKH